MYRPSIKSPHILTDIMALKASIVITTKKPSLLHVGISLRTGRVV